MVGWIALLYGRAEGPRPIVYLIVGLIVWYFMLKSGVHATIAGVLMALAIPLRHGMSVDDLREEIRFQAGKQFEQIEARIGHLERVLHKAHSPLHSMEHALQPWVAFLIMPVFALFNAGVTIGGGEGGGSMVDPISMGAFFGLLLGKPIGVVGFVWLAVKTGISKWPENTSWSAILGVGLLAGIGFTMSLFIANLAFGSGTELDQAKLGVLGASVVAAVVGLGLLHWALPKQAAPDRRAEAATQEA